MAVVLGITGGIASGKTTVLEMFRELGAGTLSADEVAREVLAKDTEAAKEVVRKFGGRVLAPDGSIDRAALGDLVFRSPGALEELDRITHPRIIAALEERIREFRKDAEQQKILAVEIPLLIECRLTYLVDKVIVVAAEQETQLSRLRTRGIAPDQARLRVAAQMPISEKLPFADWVIETDTSLDDTRRQVQSIWVQIAK